MLELGLLRCACFCREPDAESCSDNSRVLMLPSPSLRTCSVSTLLVSVSINRGRSGGQTADMESVGMVFSDSGQISAVITA